VLVGAWNVVIGKPESHYHCFGGDVISQHAKRSIRVYSSVQICPILGIVLELQMKPMRLLHS